MSSLPNEQLESRNVRASSINSNKSSKKKKNNRKKKAKQWTYYIETFKSAIDCLYEICRKEQSISACKESLMYLQNAEKDFLSLIAAINLELSFNTQDKPQAVAWEVRKSISSPNHLLSENGTPALINVLPMSPMIINDITLTSKTDALTGERDLDEGWQLVRGRRRKSASSTGTSDAFDTDSRCSLDETTTKRQLTVYERLSANVSSCRKHSTSSRPSTTSCRGSTSRPNSARLTCPKSAMDLPQTKASMAKMAYCRQRIWEKDIQPSLAEKLRANQKRERLQREAIPTKCGLNFADPSSVRVRAKEFNDKKKQQMRQQCAYSEGHRRSLQSICENVEGEDQDVVPSDPKPSFVQASKSDSPRLDRTISSITMDMEDDSEWGKMTEEEESLAMEEQSLNLEIEKAESELESIDAELARQVEDEAEQCEMTKDDGVMFIPTGKGQYSQMVKKLEEDFKTFCHESWSELVEKEFAGQYRVPGTVVERHEKLCSPNRRRCEKNDSEFSLKHNEKLRRAHEVREKLQLEKSQKLRELAQKREEVQAKRKELTERKRAHLQTRMERAQENREKTISQIVKKAKGDEQKVLEVQFIHNIQEENKRFDLMIRDAGIEERKQSMADLRAKKIEEKVAKEQAAEERRRIAEQTRVTRLQELNEKKEARHLRVTRERSLAEKEKKDKRRMREQLGKEAKALASKNDIFSNWISLCNTNQWDQLFNSRKVYKCRLCSSDSLSNIDSFAHALQDNCGGYLKRCDQIITTGYMAQHMESTVQLISEQGAPSVSSNSSVNLDGLVSSSQILRTSFRGNICNVVPSKAVKDFISLVTKPTSRKTEETVVKSIERLIAEMLQSSDKQGGHDLGSVLQFHIGDLLNFIISWNINLRVLGKLVSLIIKMMDSESFALRCFCCEQFNDICRRIYSVKEASPHSLHFCSMLRILASCFKGINLVNYSLFGLDEQIILDRLQIFHKVLSHCCKNLKPSITGLWDRSYIESLGELTFASIHNLHVKLSYRFHSDFYDMFVETALQRAKLWGTYSEKPTDSKTREEINLFIALLGKLFSLDQSKEELMQPPERIIKLFCVLYSLVRYLFLKSESVLTFNLDEQCLQMYNIVEKFATFSWSNQLLCHLEWQNISILSLLGSVSVQYIAEPKYSRITMPAFIAMTKSSRSATTLFSKIITLEYITSYIKDLLEKIPDQDSSSLSSLKGSLAFYENSVQKISKI